MRSKRLTTIIAAAIGLAGSGICGALLTESVWAGDGRSITYVPRESAVKKTRVIGESRGLSGGPSITVLAPDDTGETTLAQPTLYWYASSPISSPVEVVIVDEITQKTVFESMIEPPAEAGISTIPLSKLRVSLRPDREYRWSVSVVRDPSQRSMDLFASGSIRRAEMAPALATQLNRTSSSEMAYFLAENGLWYDALAVLSVQITRNPADKRLRDLRASLLDQVGLYEAAQFDRK